MTIRAVLLVVVVLMQCCDVFVAARPLLMEAPAVATADGGWLGMIMQVVQGPGSNGGGWQDPGHPQTNWIHAPVGAGMHALC